MEMNIEELVSFVLNAAFKVHTELGPGLLESVYETCLMHEVRKAGIPCQRQIPFPVKYDGVALDAGFRLDLLVGESLIVEVKAVEALLPIHKAQLMTYLRLSGRTLGLLINFNEVHLKHEITRVVLNHPEASPCRRRPPAPET